MNTTLYFIHDPMCSWCWAYRPTHAVLAKQLKALPINVVNVLGGLAPDSDEPMPMEMQTMLQNTWRRIEQQVGTQFNHDFWQLCKPQRSTYPACRAVLAAKQQGAEEEMIKAIQEAYYLRAMNPSDKSTLITLAAELSLNTEIFATALTSDNIQAELIKEITLARQLPIQGFPSLVLAHQGVFYSIALDYHAAETSLRQIKQISNDLADSALS